MDIFASWRLFSKHFLNTKTHPKFLLLLFLRDMVPYIRYWLRSQHWSYARPYNSELKELRDCAKMKAEIPICLPKSLTQGSLSLWMHDCSMLEKFSQRIKTYHHMLLDFLIMTLDTVTLTVFFQPLPLGEWKMVKLTTFAPYSFPLPVLSCSFNSLSSHF